MKLQIAYLFRQYIRLPPKKCTAIDSPLEEVRMTGDFGSVPGFMGRHLPFLLAAQQINILNLQSVIRAVPMTAVWIFSFQTSILPYGALLTHRSVLLLKPSPLPENSLRIWPSVKRDLRGYIFKRLRPGTAPSGMLNGRMRFLRRRLFGISTDHINKMITDIRNSSLKDQKTAARLIHKILQNSPSAVVGNKNDR